MILKERSYSTKLFRPTPKVWISDEQNLIVIASSWGDSDHAQLVIDEVSKYVLAAMSDVEVTSPFEFLPSFSAEVNYLRIGFHIANEVVFRTLNKSEFTAGVEAVAILKRGDVLAWAQVGHPSVYLSKLQGTEPIGIERSMGANLPGRLIGLDSSCYIQSGSIKIEENDQIVLLAGRTTSPDFYAQSSANLSLEGLTKAVIKTNGDDPFWLGIIDPQLA